MGMKHVETGARSSITILVTGFGSFPGAPTNPTAAVIKRLAAHRSRLARLGIRLETSLMPVVFETVGPAIRTVASATRPNVILHLGLAGRRRGISVETRAKNRGGPLHPDAARHRAAQVIAPHGAVVLPATYSATRLAVAIRATGVEAKRSIDAGDYVCNTILYRTLAERLAPVAGFLHVPRTRNPAQPRYRTRRRRPSLDDLTQAVLASVLVLARDARRQRADVLALDAWRSRASVLMPARDARHHQAAAGG